MYFYSTWWCVFEIIYLDQMCVLFVRNIYGTFLF